MIIVAECVTLSRPLWILPALSLLCSERSDGALPRVKVQMKMPLCAAFSAIEPRSRRLVFLFNFQSAAFPPGEQLQTLFDPQDHRAVS